jgi:DNA-binding MarR family transcriptional regulator
MAKLTPVLQRTLLAIHQFRVKNGYMPTLSEIAIELNYATSGIQTQVDKLITLGYLSKSPETPGHRGSQWRSIRFTQSITHQGNNIPVLGVCK